MFCLFASDAQTPPHNRFLRVQAVFGLVKDHRMRAIHDGRCRLILAVGGKAMHEQGVGFGVAHQLLIYLIGAQHIMAALFGGLAVMHADPGVGDHQIGTLDGAKGLDFSSGWNCTPMNQG